jgi:hypothetical protein
VKNEFQGETILDLVLKRLKDSSSNVFGNRRSIPSSIVHSTNPTNSESLQSLSFAYTVGKLAALGVDMIIRKLNSAHTAAEQACHALRYVRLLVAKSQPVEDAALQLRNAQRQLRICWQSEKDGAPLTLIRLIAEELQDIFLDLTRKFEGGEVILQEDLGQDFSDKP